MIIQHNMAAVHTINATNQSIDLKYRVSDFRRSGPVLKIKNFSADGKCGTYAGEPVCGKGFVACTLRLTGLEFFENRDCHN